MKLRFFEWRSQDAFNATPLVSGNPEGRWFIMHIYIKKLQKECILLGMSVC